MTLTKPEFEILWQIEEGISDTKNLENFINLDPKLIQTILTKLEKLELIKVIRKKDNWIINTTEKAKEEYKKYKKWIPS